jgi:glutathione S-transferase
VPALIDGDVTVWESLAIGEYLAEKYPQHAMWPSAPAARAHARSVSAEMHAGFAQLRTHMPMNIRAHHPGKGRTPEVDADIARVCSLWDACLAASGGPFLFGHFTVADAMYAPVVSRFITYAVEVGPRLDPYVERIWNLPAMQAWRTDALAETEVIDVDEPYR